MGSVSTGIPVTGKKGRKQKAEELAEKIVAPKISYFLDYLESFWMHDSPYVKSKRLVDKKPLSATSDVVRIIGISDVWATGIV